MQGDRVQQKQREARSENFRGRRKKIILRLCYDLLGLDSSPKIVSFKGRTTGERRKKEKQRKAKRNRKTPQKCGRGIGGRGEVTAR